MKVLIIFSELLKCWLYSYIFSSVPPLKWRTGLEMYLSERLFQQYTWSKHLFKWHPGAKNELKFQKPVSSRRKTEGLQEAVFPFSEESKNYNCWHQDWKSSFLFFFTSNVKFGYIINIISIIVMRYESRCRIGIGWIPLRCVCWSGDSMEITEGN